jgi:hypothetical protein
VSEEGEKEKRGEGRIIDVRKRRYGDSRYEGNT